MCPLCCVCDAVLNKVSFKLDLALGQRNWCYFYRFHLWFFLVSCLLWHASRGACEHVSLSIYVRMCMCDSLWNLLSWLVANLYDCRQISPFLQLMIDQPTASPSSIDRSILIVVVVVFLFVWDVFFLMFDNGVYDTFDLVSIYHQYTSQLYTIKKRLNYVCIYICTYILMYTQLYLYLWSQINVIWFLFIIFFSNYYIYLKRNFIFVFSLICYNYNFLNGEWNHFSIINTIKIYSNECT